VGSGVGVGVGDGLGDGVVEVEDCCFGIILAGARRGRERDDGYRLEAGYKDSGLLWCLREICPWTSCEVAPLAGVIVSSAGAVVRGWVPWRFSSGLNRWTAGEMQPGPVTLPWEGSGRTRCFEWDRDFRLHRDHQLAISE
jgi:hypothetical protein